MGKLDKLKEKRKQINNSEENVIVPKVQNQMVSKIDYSKYNLDKETTEFLLEREFLLTHTSKEISKNLAEQSKAFYEAQQKLSERQGGDGTFIEWFSDLGYSRPYVYRAINAYDMFLNYNTEKIFELPARIRQELYKKRNEFDNAEVIEIISNDEPQKKLKEIEKSKIEQEEIEKYKNIDTDLKRYQVELKIQKGLIYDKKIELEKAKEEYEKIKKELQKLKETEKELVIKIKISKQEM